jgi:ParB family chromosome partitioning protein
MTKKKRFGISAALTRGLSETIDVVEHHTGLFRNIVLPLSRIELDPDNPRKLTIDLSDVRHGIRPEDPAHQVKQVELERLKELAQTIQASGIINPVVAYKLGEYYRIVAGERRCLAAILAGKQEIEARIFNEKPTHFDLKLMQWIENTAREDLTLIERLDNMKDIMATYQHQHGQTKINATLLKNITGLSLSQMTYYLAVLNAPMDLQEHVQNGNIRNLDKAALIAGMESREARARAIEACIQGMSLRELRKLVQQQTILEKQARKPLLSPSKKGRATTKIQMGSTEKTTVIQTIIRCVLSGHELGDHTAWFKSIDWSNMRQVSQAFRKLISILENENRK